ncbi:MAG TPA: hypothetical protein VIJ99_01370 [Acidimicrobiales bacterium]
MTVLPNENSVICDEENLVLRHYYPWGNKTIPYTSIVGVQMVKLTPARGQLRVWGSANPTLWANLDGRRRKKSVGLVLDIGKKVKPYITPDDLDHVDEIIREKAGLGPGTPAILSPFI